MVKLVDTRDLKSLGHICPSRFEPGSGTEKPSSMVMNKVKPNGAKLIEHTRKIGHHEFRSIISDGEDSPIVPHSN